MGCYRHLAKDTFGPVHRSCFARIYTRKGWVVGIAGAIVKRHGYYSYCITCGKKFPPLYAIDLRKLKYV